MKNRPISQFNSEELKEFIAQVIAQDEPAVLLLIEEYAEPIGGIVQVIVKDERNHQEAILACFSAIRQQLLSFDPEFSRFFTWIIGIARTVALSYQTKQMEVEEELDIFQLIYFYNFSRKEIASKLGITELEVGRRFRERIQQLKKESK